MIYLIRHAESTSNQGNRIYCRPQEVPLSPVGIKQALKLAHCLNNIRPDLIVLSEYARTHQTAAPIIQKYPIIPTEIWSEINEVCFLPYHLIKGTTTRERIELVNNLVLKNGLNYAIDETSESFNDVVKRATTFLEKLSNLPKEKNIFVFSHSGFMRMFLMVKDNLPLDLNTFLSMSKINNTQIIQINL